jgi:hypothetical protein
MKIEFSRQIFEKCSNIKFRTVGAEVFHVDGNYNVYIMKSQEEAEV